MQRRLSQWATDDPTKQFVDLYSLLCHEVWLRVAHHHVNANQGRETAGIDGETMSNFNGNLEGNLEILVVGADFSWGRAGIAAKTRYAFGIPSQGFQRRLLSDAMPSRQHTR